MESNTNHFWNLKNSIELENAYQEKQRMESHLRLGNVPAHISHPIAAALVGRGNAMDVGEEEVVENGLVQEMAQREGSKYTQTSTRAAAEKNGVPNMGRFTTAEKDVARSGATGVANRLLYPDAISSRNVKVRARNVETQKALPTPITSERSWRPSRR